MTATLKAYLKDPGETQLYGLDWSEMLAGAGLGGEAIVGFDVVVPAGLTRVTQQRDGAVTSAWIGGGALGSSHVVTFRLLLANPTGAGDPIAWERSIRITVADR